MAPLKAEARSPTRPTGMSGLSLNRSMTAGKARIRRTIFRRSGPAVVGVRVLGGRIHIGQRLLTLTGEKVGRVKSIRVGDNSLKESTQGDEVALAIEGAVVGRGIDEEDVLLVDIPASHARQLRKIELTSAEEEILEELTRLHRKDDHFWGL